MANHGGRRNRSGPVADLNSGRSDRRGLSFKQLPAEGWAGKVPEFPLPTMKRTKTEIEHGVKTQVPDNTTTMSLRRREMQLWREAWALPQGAAWSSRRNQWLHPIIAEYCRLKAIVERGPDSSAALVAQLHRYRDQIGLTQAGMRELGWGIAEDELADKRAETAAEAATAAPPSSRDRMKAIAGGR